MLRKIYILATPNTEIYSNKSFCGLEFILVCHFAAEVLFPRGFMIAVGLV